MFNDKLTCFVRDDIRRRIDKIDDSRFNASAINEEDLADLSSYIETFVSIAEGGKVSASAGTDLILEARLYERKFRMLCEERRLMKSCRINEARRYGFENCFPEYSNQPTQPVPVQPKADDSDPVRINRISISKDKTNAGVRIEGGGVVADRHYSRRELIEACPVRYIEVVAMNARSIREIAIEIDPAEGIYGIPFGYAIYYLDSTTTGKEPNARYEIVPEAGNGYDALIKIYATQKIRPGDPIIIESGDGDFENVMYERKFGHEGEKDVYVETKDFKFA